MLFLCDQITNSNQAETVRNIYSRRTFCLAGVHFKRRRGLLSYCSQPPEGDQDALPSLLRIQNDRTDGYKKGLLHDDNALFENKTILV